jgi:cytochrome c oxidase assembly protein subunit 15
VGYAALGVVVAQGLLGGITVLFFLPTPISVAHACLAQIFFSLTIVLALATSERWQQPAARVVEEDSPPLSQMTILTSAAIFLQLVMGAALRHKGFGILPHLIGAGVVTALVLWTLYRVLSRHSILPSVFQPAVTLGGLLMVQLLLGGASYLVREATAGAPQPMPVMVYITVAHVAVGAATLASSVWLMLEANRVLRPALGPQRAQAALTT